MRAIVLSAMFIGACTSGPQHDTDATSDTDAPPDTDEGDTDPPVGIEGCGGMLATHGQFFRGATARDDAEAFCEDYVGTAPDVRLDVDNVDWEDLSALDCLRCVGDMVVHPSPSLRVVDLPDLFRVGDLFVQGRLERISLPALETARDLSVSLSPMSGPGADLRLPKMTRATTMVLEGQFVRFPTMPDLEGITVSLRLIRPSLDQAYEGGSIDVPEVRIEDTSGAGLDDVLPCFDISEMLYLKRIRGQRLDLPLCGPTPFVLVDTLPDATTIEADTVVEVERGLTLFGAPTLAATPGLAIGPEITDLTYFDTQLPIPVIEPTTMHTLQMEPYADFSSLDHVTEVEGLILGGAGVTEPFVGMAGLLHADNVQIRGEWSAIRGLTSWTTADWVEIHGRSAFKDLNSLGALRRVTSRLEISGNDGLEDLSGLHDLEYVDNLIITWNPNLPHAEAAELVDEIDRVRLSTIENNGD